MDDNEKLQCTVDGDATKLPMLGKITRGVVISYIAALASMCAVLALYSIFSTRDMKVTLYYLGAGAVRRVCGPSVPEWVDYLFLFLLVTVFVLKVAFWFFVIADRVENGHEMWKRVLLKVVAGVIALFVGSIGMSKTSDYREYVKYGNDRTCYAEYYRKSREDRTVIIREWSFLFAGGAEVYQLMDDASMVLIGEFGTDDGERHRGQDGIDWQDDGVTIEYRINSITKKVYCQWVG